MIFSPSLGSQRHKSLGYFSRFLHFVLPLQGLGEPEFGFQSPGVLAPKTLVRS